MRKIFAVIVMSLWGVVLYGQNDSMEPTLVSSATYVREIPSLSSMDNIIAAVGFQHVAPPKRRGSNTFVAGKGLPAGPDPLVQQQRNTQTTQGRAPITSFIAHQGTVLNDPTGAIGPNHYVYAFNSGFGILDRSGNVLVPEASLGTLFPGETLGDPVVVYDRYADRFIIMEFSNSPNGFLIAVGQGPDPVNDGWYTYRFNTGTFPDYEKLSVWTDGYYITANKDQGSLTSSEVVYAVERDEMLTGNPNAQLIGFPLPSASNSGFYSPGGFNATGPSLPPLGTPHPIVYLQDDSWSGVSTDHLKIWNISVNWNNPGSSSISSPQTINTNSFDSVFDGGSFQNLDEPGSGPDIDALQATMMYQTNYRRFTTHNSAVMNFVVDVSGNDTKAGIRWFELRQSADGQPWTIHQEGTYSQPNHSVFCGSIGMDSQGNIGLGYTIVSSSVYTSLRYTGRLASDPLGVMTVAEQVIVNGNAQNNRSDGRYGDYAHLTIDPLDDFTFWHIGEYMQGSASTVRKSHVAAFQIGTLSNDTDPPTAPSNLTASNITATTVDLNWTASTDNIGVTGYDVYRDGLLAGTVTGTSYTATGLSPSTSYSFYVIARDAAGNQSPQSNTVNPTTAAVTACSGGISSFPYAESFESSFGAWTQDSSDDINWTRNSGGTPSSNTGPSAAADGTWYAYVEASSPNYPNIQAILNSPCFDLNGASQATFSFQYHMYGAADLGTFNLEASNDNGLSWTSVWSQSGNQGNQWNSVDVDLSAYAGDGVQLRFNRVTGSTWQADIAIDDLSLSTTVNDTQAPTAPSNLTASNTTTSSTDLSWTASTDNVGVTGYNVFQGGSQIGTTAGTTYNVIGLSPDTAYNFYVIAFDAAGNQSPQSNTVNITTDPITGGGGCSGGITSYPYSESFESSFGAWTQDTGDDINWTRDSGGTPSSNTGPSSGADGSWYVYVEASSPNYPNIQAILNSPCFDLSGESQALFSFEYHMYGATDMGTFALEASDDDGTTWTSLWSQTGNQGNQWNSVDVDLAAYVGGSVQLRFNRITGSTWQADIAVDAIGLDTAGVDTQAPTAPSNLTASNTTTTTTDLSWTASTDNVGVTGYDVYQNGSQIGTTSGTSYDVTGLSPDTVYSFYVIAFDAAGNQSAQSNTANVTTDPVSGVGGCSGGISSFPYSESFESGIGAWTQDTGDDINWTRDSGGTPSSNTGPSGGADGSWYMYVEASSPNYPNIQAILNSPCFDLSGETQATFSFQYHMYGATDMGSFALEASDDDGATWTSIWSQSGNQGNQWNSADVDLAAYVGGSVQLRFNRVTGSTWQADIAIDDVSVSTGGSSNNCAAANLTLTITLDNYPEETAWTLQTSGGATVASNSYSTANPDGSTVVENINGLSSGDYTFTITDSYGDGICCSYGNGSYTLESAVGVIVTGGNFGSSESTNFCVDDTKAPSNAPINTRVLAGTDVAQFKVYPNPAQTHLNIETLGQKVDDVKIFSMYGILVRHIEDLKGNSIDVSGLSSATYFIRITSGDTEITRKFLKE